MTTLFGIKNQKIKIYCTIISIFKLSKSVLESKNRTKKLISSSKIEPILLYMLSLFINNRNTE